MKVETRMFVILALFFVPIGFIYGFWSGWREPVGPFGLFLTSGLCGLVAFYLAVTARRFQDRPEDNPNAEISDQEGDYGVFAPYSWWPLWLGASAAVVFLGLAVGWWVVIIGGFFGIVALVGWTFEHYRGVYAH